MDLPTGKIQTVCGPIDPNEAGFTLMHEHLNHLATAVKFNPRTPDARYAHMVSTPFNPSNRWWIEFHPYSHLDNLKFDDQLTRDAVEQEMNFYYANGGRTIVELTTFGRDLEFFERLQKKTKINIVAGTGFYVANGLPTSTLALTTEQIYDFMIHELSGPRPCGIVGEIASCDPIHEFERKCLLAAGQLSEQYPSLPVNVHPGRERSKPLETMRVFLEAGGNKEKFVMSHLDRTLMDKESLLEFAKLGCVCELDLFGIETTHYELSDKFNFIGDAQRIQCLRWLIEDGHLERIVISQDIHTKHRMMQFGGHGYSHILMNVVPELRRHAFTEAEIDQITVQTPKRLLTL